VSSGWQSERREGPPPRWPRARLRARATPRRRRRGRSSRSPPPARTQRIPRCSDVQRAWTRTPHGGSPRRAARWSSTLSARRSSPRAAANRPPPAPTTRRSVSHTVVYGASKVALLRAWRTSGAAPASTSPSNHPSGGRSAGGGFHTCHESSIKIGREWHASKPHDTPRPIGGCIVYDALVV
jgi:hypothetical protein